VGFSRLVSELGFDWPVDVVLNLNRFESFEFSDSTEFKGVTRRAGPKIVFLCRSRESPIASGKVK
jgi:hypothetical protein